MYEHLTDTEKQLADLMSEISEEAFSAGWMMNLEYGLWNALLNDHHRYGRYHIAKEDIAKLIKLSKDCNCWIVYDDNTEETAMPLDKWQEKFETDIAANERLVEQWHDDE